jgi:hypothetical protein
MTNPVPVHKGYPDYRTFERRAAFVSEAGAVAARILARRRHDRRSTASPAILKLMPKNLQ